MGRPPHRTRTRDSHPSAVATIRDVARQANVSTATVSRVLADLNVVSDALAKRVHAAARQLKFQPNRVARNLRARTTHTIGVLIPNIQNPFFTGVIRGIEDLLSTNDYTMLLGNSDDNPSRETTYLDLLRAEGVGGLILVPTPESRKAYEGVIASGMPVVTIDQCIPDLGCDSVIVSNAEGAKTAILHLIATGHRRIAIITGPEGNYTATERLAGYELAMAEAQLPRSPALVRHAPFRSEGGYTAAQTLLALPQPPTAIFAASDMIALGTLRAVHERGLRIPHDMAVVSFDDMPWAAALAPPLTAISQPTREMGTAAARLLLDRIRDASGAPRRVQMPTTLVVRASSGPHDAQPRG